MIAVYRTLVARDLGRLASDRIALIGAIVVLVVLASGAAFVATSVTSAGNDPERQAATLRSDGWGRGSMGFDMMLGILATILGVSFLGSDRKQGTQFGILARPVSRTSVFVSSWIAVAMLVTILGVVRSAILVGAVARLEDRIDPLHVLGAVAVIAGTGLVVAVFATLSALIQPAYSVLVGVIGMYVTSFAFSDSTFIGRTASWALNSLGSLMPLSARQAPTIVEALHGSTRDTGPILEVIAYRLSWTVLLLCVGAIVYTRRDLTHKG